MIIYGESEMLIKTFSIKAIQMQLYLHYIKLVYNQAFVLP